MDTRKINVADLINNTAIGSFHIRMAIVCSACLMIAGFDVQAMGYAAPGLVRDWQIAGPTLGPVFSAAFVGVLVGSLLFSVLADRFGRRPMLIAATLFFALMTLWTARAESVNELLAARFLAGVGLGGAMPNVVALVGEYTPARWRLPAIMIVGNGFNLGAALGGLFAAWLIPNFGWRSVFYFGGAVPLLIAAVMILKLPESLQLMVLRGMGRERIRSGVKQFSAAAPAGSDIEYVVHEEKKEGVPVIHLFSSGRGTVTLLLWTAFFLNLLNLFLLASWLPTLVSASGYPTSTAVLVGTTLQAGGTIGGYLLAWIIGRVGLVPSLGAGFVMASICIGLIGQPGLSLALLFVVVFLAGCGILGGQNSLNTLAASFYPTYLRSTGVGWCLGIGRVGAIVGPLFAGELLRRNWGNQQLFLAAGSLAAVAAIIMVSLKFLMSPKSEAAPAVAGQFERVKD